MNDPEINAMATISSALDALDEAARERVIRWARDRYVPAKLRPTSELATTADRGTGTDRLVDLPREQVKATYTDLADLYATANPSTDSEKVLVVGWWFQAVRGEGELDSQTINAELKNLGYPIGNVTRAVTGLARSLPRLIVQTKKTGSTKQARKRFKLTVEGLKRVEQMIGLPRAQTSRLETDDTISDESRS